MKTLREYIDIIAEATSTVPYLVDTSSGKPMANVGNGLVTIVPSKLWTAITPDVIKRAESQAFTLVRLQYNGVIMQGFEGGDPVLKTKIIVAPADYAKLTAPKV